MCCDDRKGILVIDIPTQPPASIPFFVRRAQIAGKIRTNHFALPMTVGDSNAAWDIAEVHTLIVAGRAALAIAQT